MYHKQMCVQQGYVPSTCTIEICKNKFTKS